jgi:hypothetical protein
MVNDPQKPAFKSEIGTPKWYPASHGVSPYFHQQKALVFIAFHKRGISSRSSPELQVAPGIESSSPPKGPRRTANDPPSPPVAPGIRSFGGTS